MLWNPVDLDGSARPRRAAGDGRPASPVVCRACRVRPALGTACRTKSMAIGPGRSAARPWRVMSALAARAHDRYTHRTESAVDGFPHDSARCTALFLHGAHSTVCRVNWGVRASYVDPASPASRMNWAWAECQIKGPASGHRWAKVYLAFGSWRHITDARYSSR